MHFARSDDVDLLRRSAQRYRVVGPARRFDLFRTAAGTGLLQHLFDLFPGFAGPLLDASDQFTFLALDELKIVIGEPGPFLPQPAFDDVPIPFHFQNAHIGSRFFHQWFCIPECGSSGVAPAKNLFAVQMPRRAAPAVKRLPTSYDRGRLAGAASWFAACTETRGRLCNQQQSRVERNPRLARRETGCPERPGRFEFMQAAKRPGATVRYALLRRAEERGNAIKTRHFSTLKAAARSALKIDLNA